MIDVKRNEAKDTSGDTSGGGYDAVVVGAGPGGCAVSTALAQMGRRVVVLEKDEFPRYHIGESLIPYTWFALKRIGMIEKLRASDFVQKVAVSFVSQDGRESAPFYFHKHTDHECAYTWQVERPAFDLMLRDHAAEHGVEVRMKTTAKELLYEGERVGGVRAVGPDGQAYELRAPITVDASGRDVFAAGKNDWKMMDGRLKKIACWSYYKGAKRDPGVDQGTTTVAYMPGKGWFWYIPLRDDIVSVGIVCERDYLYRDGKGDPDAIFEREVQLQAWVKDHVAGAERIAPCRVTGDYSYRSRYCAADGLVLVGDAYAFLDPVFSSGVFLALHSGVLAADAIGAALKAGDVSAERFTAYGDRLRSDIEAMRRLVYAFYDEGFNFRQMIKRHPHLTRDLTDCIIGNLNKDFDPLYEAMSEFAAIPGPLEHGRPLVKTSAT